MKLSIEYLAGVLIISFMILLCLCLTAYAEDVDIERYADAIWHAEGGSNTNFPYGIKSVSCDGQKECRRICKNTVRNNVKRFNKWGHKSFDSFLEFLASRYCPVPGDKTGLNKNWISNVSWYLNNPKGVN